MAQEKPAIIERSSQEAYAWLNDIADGLNREGDLRGAYDALRAVLHTLRDTLLPEEAMDLASQLPTLIRGVFFEGYHLRKRPMVYRSQDEFAQAIDDLLSGAKINVLDPETCARVVFGVLSERISEGQAAHARGMLNKEAQRLWPEGALR